MVKQFVFSQLLFMYRLQHRCNVSASDTTYNKGQEDEISYKM